MIKSNLFTINLKTKETQTKEVMNIRVSKAKLRNKNE